ncbi:MAG TPA: hypothetical protein VGH91_13765 [Gammaproteobacteria bacterium]|jgi:hypothetical protein
MRNTNYGQRLTAVETELQAVRVDVRDMREDVKTLLAAYNRQSGAAKLRAALWTGLVGLSAAVGGVFAGRGH